MTTIKLNDHVIVKCPVYRNGHKFEGICNGVNPLTGQLKIIVAGNKKSTRFAAIWVTKK